MKTIEVKLRIGILVILALWSINSFAQTKTIYVMKGGKVVFQASVSDIDNVTFDEVTSIDTLIVHKNDNSPAEKIRLEDIQQLSFSDENLLVEMMSGNEIYAFDDITKLLFNDDGATGIHHPSSRDSFDVFVFVAATGDVIVESAITIKSLTLFGVDGKMISRQDYNSVESQYMLPLQDHAVGIYLLRVETEQGTIVKKVVKS